MTEQVHGTAVRLSRTGVLFRGAPGSGKSDLALRLLDEGALDAVLVGDDRLEMLADGGRLVARVPGTIAGRLEIRGVGIVRKPYVESCDIALVIDLVPQGQVPRWPDREADRVTICEIGVGRICLAPFEASAPAKVRALVVALEEDGFAENL